MLTERIAIVVLGLAATLGLAFLGAHPFIRKWEQRLGITVLLSTGIPFLALGALFSTEQVGILTPSILEDIRPAFNFALGWVGFIIGMHFNIRRLDRLPNSTAPVVVIQAVLPMLMTALLCGAVLYGFNIFSKTEDLLFSTLLLVACAAASAPISIKALSKRYGGNTAYLLDEINNLDEIASLFMLAVITILFRPEIGEASTWILPSSAWVLIMLGVSALLGIVTYILIRSANSDAEQLALLIGAVALTAGIAEYLYLSIPVVCALAGMLLVNLPLRNPDKIHKKLVDLERPMYLIFLLIVGASWNISEWQGWMLAPVFVLARAIGKTFGAMLGKRFGPKSLPDTSSFTISLLPQSPIAIVVIVSVASLQNLILPNFIRWSINAIIVGSVLTEILTKILGRFASIETDEAEVFGPRLPSLASQDPDEEVFS